jgi:hypothetical protein
MTGYTKNLLPNSTALILRKNQYAMTKQYFGFLPLLDQLNAK